MDMISQSIAGFATLCKHFDPTGTDVSDRWTEWLSNFDNVASVANIEEENKLQWLLIFAGPKVQNIFKFAKKPANFFVLSPYRACLKTLENHFAAMSTPFVREEQFLECKQKLDEDFNTYLIRLQAAADRCKFKADADEKILHQIARGAKDKTVQVKCRTVTNLNKAVKFALAAEVSQLQKDKESQVLRRMENDIDAISKFNVNKASKSGVTQKPPKFASKRGSSASSECYRCGSFSHKASFKGCPAHGAECNNCSKIGHFSRVCQQPKKKGADSVTREDEV